MNAEQKRAALREHYTTRTLRVGVIAAALIFLSVASRYVAHTTNPDFTTLSWATLTAFIMAAFTTSGLLPLAALVQAIRG